MSLVMNQHSTEQAYEAVKKGVTVPELAESWGVSPGAIYGALKRYQFDLPKAVTPTEHLHLQRESGLPPDLYAARANISVASLRTYASAAKTTLALRLHSETRDWWEAKISRLDPSKVQNFCIREDIPVHLLANWFHKINAPQETLLWGFSELREVTDPMFSDPYRLANPHAPTHILGKGNLTARIDLRVASEAYKHSRAYRYKQH